MNVIYGQRQLLLRMPLNVHSGIQFISGLQATAGSRLLCRSSGSVLGSRPRNACAWTVTEQWDAAGLMQCGSCGLCCRPVTLEQTDDWLV